MNKKGMTLVELLAVIAIVAVLAIMITPGLMSLRTNVLRSTLKSRVSQIENAACDYGQKNINLIPNAKNTYDGVRRSDDEENCRFVTVDFLISNGYLSSKNSYNTSGETEGVMDNQITNPLTGENMNDMLVCIRFDNDDPLNRTIIAYLIGIDEEDLED